MICPHCGKENLDDADVCQHCGEPLAPAGSPPRLLGQIQGLVPAEPVIVRGQRQRTEPPPLEHLPDPALFSQLQVEEPTPAPQPGPANPAPQPEAPARPPEPPATEPPAQPGPVIPPQPRQTSHLLIPALFFLVILVGAFIQPLATRKPHASIPVKNLFSYIEILPPGSRVLLAWDYDPATQGEMQLLAQPILRHLQRKHVQIVNVSLRPFGPNVATDAQSMKQWPMSAQAAAPIEFGFIPGGSAALRALTHSPVIASNQPRTSARASGLRPADTLAAFDLVIEFSASFANSQEWVEQVASRTQKPFIVAASGAVAPLLRPYQQTHQIRVLLSGYPDALAYESLLKHYGPAHQQRTAQTLALGLLLILVLIAATRSLFRK